MTAIRLLTFDLDDTLWDLRPILMRADQITFDWLTAQAPALSAHFTLEQFREYRLQLALKYPKLQHLISELRLRAQREILQQAGYGEAEAQQLSQQAFEVFMRARHDVNFFESAIEVLTQLQKQFVLAAITNGNASPSRLGLDHLFAFTITAEKLSQPKPHPEPFLAALHQAQCKPAQAIHIGDHADHDIRGAMQAGLFAIWVNRENAVWLGDDIPNAIIRHLAELPDAVRSIAGTFTADK
jgi:FMN hydrolase / 5-amino-6-(5-phospho-D-ribitylamino)uracil phosphatase